MTLRCNSSFPASCSVVAYRQDALAIGITTLEYEPSCYISHVHLG